jgi:enamine deaminase RidA (YjgF/YER057c/UK114 family)
MKLLPCGNEAQQTERVRENVKAILTHAGLTLSHVVKIKVFLKRELPASGMS